MTVSTKNKKHYARRKGFQDTAPDPLVMRSCPQAKIAYKSKRIAECKAAMALKRGNTLYTYKCPHCRLWHLTSLAQL